MTTTPAKSKLVSDFPPDERAALESLGPKFRDAWVYIAADALWLHTPQVDDPSTFDETLDAARSRLKGDYAVYPYGGSWVLVGGQCGYAKDYPSREAAEMVAIHGG